MKHNVNRKERIKRAMTFYGVIKKLMVIFDPKRWASFCFCIQED